LRGRAAPAAAAGAGENPDGPRSAELAELAARLHRETGLTARLWAPLAELTTMRVGGPADLAVAATSVPALVAAVRFAREAGIPVHLLGRGSDVVVGDGGVRGLVVLCRAEGVSIDGRRLAAEAGLPIARAATLAARAGLSGLEFGLAIPGSVGGAVWANAGAHGSEVAAVLESVRLLRGDGSEADELASALRLSYRDSRLKHAGGPGGAAAEIVLSAVFVLQPDEPAAIQARLDEVRRWRRDHQPLSRPSAGSVFRNPPGQSAGSLIDACGLKGERIGGALISPKHANFIVNAGGATAADVRHLAEKARLSVARRFGVDLVYEVQFVGDWPDWSQEVA
jgi:UDP-N-acetylmuramate dehydrogenase